VSSHKVLIVGVGAIGTYIGARLIKSGERVVFLARRNTAASIKKQGVVIASPKRTLRVHPIDVESSFSDAVRKYHFDIMFVAIKAYDTKGILSGILKHKEDLPPLVCLQNGVENEDAYISVLGRNKVIYGCVTSAIRRIGPGEAYIEKERGIAIENGNPFSPELIEMLKRAGFLAKALPDGLPLKWSKMLTNLLANASAAILQLSPKEIFSDKHLLGIEIEQIREALNVMRALSIRPVDLPGAPVKVLVSVLTRFPVFLSRYLMVRLMGKGRGGKMPSLLIDLQHGKTTSEAEYLNGAVARAGARSGVPTPVNAILRDTMFQVISAPSIQKYYRHRPDRLLARVRQGVLNKKIKEN
jgi:2-dehydropantoate 2-reductase